MAAKPAAGKTAKKTARSPRSGAEIPLGAHPGNTGGKKGRSGRPPGAFKDFLARLRQDPTAQDALEKAAKDALSPNFRAAWKLIAEYDEEKPAEKQQVAASMTIRVVRE